jgi:hypothetical protein
MIYRQLPDLTDKGVYVGSISEVDKDNLHSSTPILKNAQQLINSG